MLDNFKYGCFLKRTPSFQVTDIELETIFNMSKFRYDEDEDLSRHAAVSPDDCREMAKKYSWELISIEEIPPSINQVFQVDCVFRGKTEFPQTFYEKDQN
ncbi:hypothetical protein NIES4071_03580 [Calothrix sp. NIES-4071]|nr:hypothetical protein NIES4071_03580 [Calothrix sp. NIES-4071]BAZ54704.1 hypothetical protein NIES4105_03570 [Calothrix sp. NIES-4105]